jgi:hypothetical protein
MLNAYGNHAKGRRIFPGTRAAPSGAISASKNTNIGDSLFRAKTYLYPFPGRPLSGTCNILRNFAKYSYMKTDLPRSKAGSARVGYTMINSTKLVPTAPALQGMKTASSAVYFRYRLTLWGMHCTSTVGQKDKVYILVGFDGSVRRTECGEFRAGDNRQFEQVIFDGNAGAVGIGIEAEESFISGDNEIAAFGWYADTDPPFARHERDTCGLTGVDANTGALMWNLYGSGSNYLLAMKVEITPIT